MLGKRAYMVVAAILALAVLGVIGWRVGITLGSRNANRDIAANERTRASAVLRRSVGLSIGRLFPELMLWSPDGRVATSLADVLPSGGRMLYVSPTCGSCIRASLAFNGWLQAQHGDPRAGVIVTDDAAATPIFAGLLSDSAVALPVYCDVTQSLRRDYGMMENPAFFILNGHELMLEQAGVWSEQRGFILAGD